MTHKGEDTWTRVDKYRSRFVTIIQTISAAIPILIIGYSIWTNNIQVVLDFFSLKLPDFLNSYVSTAWSDLSEYLQNILGETTRSPLVRGTAIAFLYMIFLAALFLVVYVACWFPIMVRELLAFVLISSSMVLAVFIWHFVYFDGQKNIFEWSMIYNRHWGWDQGQFFSSSFDNKTLAYAYLGIFVSGIVTFFVSIGAISSAFRGSDSAALTIITALCALVVGGLFAWNYADARLAAIKPPHIAAMGCERTTWAQVITRWPEITEVIASTSTAPKGIRTDNGKWSIRGVSCIQFTPGSQTNFRIAYLLATKFGAPNECSFHQIDGVRNGGNISIERSKQLAMFYGHDCTQTFGTVTAEALEYFDETAKRAFFSGDDGRPILTN